MTTKNILKTSFHHHFCWDHYYDKTLTIEDQYEDKNYTSESDILKPSKGNTYVYNCFFHDIQTEEDGGSISFSKQGNNILIEQCLFYSISASNQGAIRVSAGNSILAFLCGQKCNANGNDGFCSINSDKSRSINSVFYSSISQCEAESYYTMVHDYGYVYIKTVNISHNNATYYSALRCGPNKIIERTNHGTDVLYCSFSNNTAASSCFLVSNAYDKIADIKHETRNCNIIENPAIKTMTSQGKTKIVQTCILNNGNPSFNLYDEQSSISLELYN